MQLCTAVLKATGVLFTMVFVAACSGTSKPPADFGSSSRVLMGSSSSAVAVSSAVSSSSVADSGWFFCADEGAVCELQGLRAVRFGNANAWATAIAQDSVLCSSDFFIAGLSGSLRQCEYSAQLVMPADPLVVTGAAVSSFANVAGIPPHAGTVFLDGDIIRPGDPTTYFSMVYKGQAERRAWHSELQSTRTFNAHIFELSFDDGDTSEIAVEDSLGNENLARDEVQKLAVPLGQVPAIMRKAVNSLTIFAGNGRGTASGGGLISTYADDNDQKIRDGFIEEFLAHECTHASLDAIYYANAGYREAARADNNYISTYAADNPNSEDISETLVPYLAVRLRADRITADWEAKIRAAMGNRIAFFDNQKLDFYPVHNTAKNVRSQLSAPVAGDTLQSTSETFEWSLTQQASAYDLIVGTLGQGSNNIRASLPFVNAFIPVDNLPDDGRKVFVRLGTQVQGKWRYEDYTYKGFNRDQTAANLLAPQAGAILSSTQLTLSWDRPLGAKRYDLVVGDKNPGSNNIRQSQPLEANTLELLNLPTQGQTLYLRLFTENPNWEYRDYTVTAANNRLRAQLLWPLQAADIKGSSIIFKWDTPLGATNYDLLIGTSGPGSTDVRASSVLRANSLQVTNLPTSDKTLYVRLWTFKTSWEFTDYQF